MFYALKHAVIFIFHPIISNKADDAQKSADAKIKMELVSHDAITEEIAAIIDSTPMII